MGFFARKQDIYSTGGAVISASGTTSCIKNTTTSVESATGQGVFYAYNWWKNAAGAHELKARIEIDGERLAPSDQLAVLAYYGFTNETLPMALTNNTDALNAQRIYYSKGIAFNESLDITMYNGSGNDLTIDRSYLYTKY